MDIANPNSRLDLLLRLVESVNLASPDLDQVLQRVVESATRLAADSLSTVWIFETERLRARARAASKRRSNLAGIMEVAIGEGLIGHAALSREILLVHDIFADPRTVNHTFFKAEALVACAAIPLIVHDRLLGVLSLLTHRAEDLGPAEVEILTAFGNHAAMAIESARLYVDAERRRRETETLAGVARDLAQLQDLDTVLERITDGARALCAADVASLALRDADGSFGFRLARGANTDAYRRLRIVPGRGAGGLAAVTGRPVRLADRVAGPELPPAYAEAVKAEGIRSTLVVPISVGDVVEGLLYVCSRMPRTFGDFDENLLLRLADHAAAAIRNSYLFAAEQTARTKAVTSERKFRDLVDTLDAIVLEMDTETFEVTFVNRRAETILGYPLERWYAEPDFWLNHLHPDDRARAVSTSHAATVNGRDHSREYRMLAADSHVMWLHDTVRVLPDPAGGRRRTRSVMVDITERKRTEGLLAGEREILGGIVGGASIPTVLDGICRLIESLRDDLLASILLLDTEGRLRHGAAPSLPEPYVRAIDGSVIGPSACPCGTAAYRKELVIVSDIAADPMWAPYRDLTLSHGLRACWSSPVCDATGDVMATFTVYHRAPHTPSPDELELVSRAVQITRIALERERATLALRRSEERYRALVTHIPVVSWLSDSRGSMLFISPNVRDVVGFTADELVWAGPATWFGRIHRDDVVSVRAQFDALVRRGEPFDVEYRTRHKDGRWIWVHDRAVSTYEQDGVVHVAGVLADITDRKQAETVRSLLLRHVVNVQEAERARLARELHDETAQSLAAMLIGLHRMREASTLGESRQQAARLHSLTVRALDEVRRMSRGLRPRALDDFGLVAALERYAAEFGEVRNLAISVEAIGLDDRRLPPEVEIALYRIMQEALSNVARHARASRATVTVRRRDAVVTMTVADEGQGFDVAVALRTTEGPTGLGLHSIRERAAVLRGTVTFDSTPGQGTRVVVEIPLPPETA